MFVDWRLAFLECFHLDESYEEYEEDCNEIMKCRKYQRTNSDNVLIIDKFIVILKLGNNIRLVLLNAKRYFACRSKRENK